MILTEYKVNIMIRSMTAFSSKTKEDEWGTLVCEIRSVNHRYLELVVRMPEELRSMEGQVRELITGRIKRGKVECNFRFKLGHAQEADIHINQDLAVSVINASKQATKVLHQSSEINAMDVLKWPGVVIAAEKDLQPVLQALIDLVSNTMDDFIQTRETEGEGLAALIMQRRDNMMALIKDEKTRRPQLIEAYRKKMRARLDELKVEPDMDRFEQELLYLTQKMDIDEELDRLDVHVEELKNIFSRNEPVGRRLDFIMQELNREANTLGSKSVDIKTTQTSVELKVLIEQMREQVQNIE